MGCLLRIRALWAPAFASLVLLPFSLALAQDPNGEPGGAGEPGACQTRCKQGAEEVFFNAKRLGASDEMAQARADFFLEMCLKGCDPIEPPIEPPIDPPPPQTCVERCGMAAAQLKERLAAVEPPLSAEDIARKVGEFLRSCEAGCVNVPPVPCETECEKLREALLARCGANTAAGVVDEECTRRVDLEVRACMARCTMPPDPEPTCETRCNERMLEAMKRCVNEDGTVDEECAHRVKAALQTCLEGCNVIEPPPPTDVPCQDRCKQVFEQVMQELRIKCADPSNVVLGECAKLREEAWTMLQTCMADCQNVVPPEPVPCAERCHLAADEMARKCPAGDEGCMARIREFLASCTAGCEEPEPRSCDEMCQAQYDSVLAKCVAGCTGDDAVDCAAKCGSTAELVLAACKLRCAGDPDPCATECAQAANQAIENCMSDPTADPRACRAKANEVLEACLREKCQVVEAPPCPDRCDADYQAWVAKCAGDPNCEAAAEAFLTNCRERCSGGGEQPPGDDTGCVSPCDEMRTTIEAMCGRLTDSPERCAALIQEFESLCVNQLGDACAAEARVKAGGFARFIRGDVARNRRVDIADPIAILMGLFQGDPRVLECEDAADANDDGALDIGDAVTVLNRLFAGGRPLPPPADDLGLDSSADALGCAEEDAHY